MERFNYAPVVKQPKQEKPLPVKTPDVPNKQDVWQKKRPMIRTPRSGKR